VLSLEDSTGRWFSSATLEPEPIRAPGYTGDDRVPVALAEVPTHLVESVLSIEDRHFFSHSGVDVVRIAGAGLANLRARGIEQGGSTITQQLAKNLFLSSRRTPLRKLRELAMAFVLEARYSKSRILETYLNQVYLGHNGGYAVHGVGRAAQIYFGKDVSGLTLSESAMLAGLIHGPNLYAPFDKPATTVARRNLVLAMLRDRGMVDSATARRAAKTRLGVQRTPVPNRAGRYFADFAARELGDRLPGRAVFTTLDMDRQIAAERAVKEGIAQIEREHPRLRRTDSPLQAALVALDPATGEILAMVGGREYGSTQFNRAADARRQPGSAFKPIVALAALTGRTVTLASRLDDEPLEVETNLGLWKPANYDGRFRGPVTLRRALEQSLNVPFARLGLALGPGEIVSTARRLGIHSPLREVPSLALGSSEVTPLELTSAYGVLAAEGFRSPPHAVRRIGQSADVRQQGVEDGGFVYLPAETFLVTSALEGAVERGTGHGLRSWGYQGPIAAKSGTSNDYRDAWFVGYTPELVLGVWVGFDDGRSLGLSGAQAALPIFARFLTATEAGNDIAFTEPPDLEIIRVNPENGLAAAGFCQGEPEYFLPGTGPAAGDDCWPGVPRWLSEAGSHAAGGIRAFIGRLFGRRERRN
jgi:penicillin-binding protein 1B